MSRRVERAWRTQWDSLFKDRLRRGGFEFRVLVFSEGWRHDWEDSSQPTICLDKLFLSLSGYFVSPTHWSCPSLLSPILPSGYWLSACRIARYWTAGSLIFRCWRWKCQEICGFGDQNRCSSYLLQNWLLLKDSFGRAVERAANLSLNI